MRKIILGWGLVVGVGGTLGAAAPAAAASADDGGFAGPTQVADVLVGWWRGRRAPPAQVVAPVQSQDERVLVSAVVASGGAAGAGRPKVMQRGTGDELTVTEEAAVVEAQAMLVQARAQARERTHVLGGADVKPGGPASAPAVPVVVVGNTGAGKDTGADEQEDTVEELACAVERVSMGTLGDVDRSGCCAVRCCGQLCCSAAGVRRRCGNFRLWCKSDDGRACHRKAAVTGLAIAGTVVSLVVAKLLGARLSVILQEYQTIKAGIAGVVGDVDIKGVYDVVRDNVAGRDDAAQTEAWKTARANELVLLLMEQGVSISADQINGLREKMGNAIMANARRAGVVRRGMGEKVPEPTDEQMGIAFLVRVGLDVE